MAVPSPLGFLLSAEPPPRRVGAIVALVAGALSTLIVYPLAHVAPVVSLSVVYLPVVLVVSAVWGAPLGIPTAVLSAAALNFFISHRSDTSRCVIQGTGSRSPRSWWSQSWRAPSPRSHARAP